MGGVIIIESDGRARANSPHARTEALDFTRKGNAREYNCMRCSLFRVAHDFTHIFAQHSAQ